MAMFGVDREEFDRFSRDAYSRIQSLESFFKSRISELEEELKLKATDSEEQARIAAESAKEIEAGIKDSASSVKSFLVDIELCSEVAKKEAAMVSAIKVDLEAGVNNMESLIEVVRVSYNDFLEKRESLNSAVTDTYNVHVELKNILAGMPVIQEQVDSILSLHDKSSEAHKNISGLLNHSLKKKSEIDALYDVVFGYEVKGEDGSSQLVEGLRDDLEKAYIEIKKEVDNINMAVGDVVRSVENDYTLSLDAQKSIFEGLISDSTSRVNTVDQQLKGLLPGGMAAGLSAAYEQKKKEEEKSQDDHGRNFKYAIIAMVVISLIPFTVDAYLFLGKGFGVLEVIKETPSLIFSILPLYFPVLWFALSTSKKLNLSKRLIEEYTHKAVLGKTFSGLSNQIASLSHEGAVKEELRTRLLFNMLQVSSENPGKLITDYNKSDHPFMEALENSSKLGGAIEALSKLPGFTALADKLSKKAQDFVESQSQKIESGLAVHEAFESKAESGKAADLKT